MVQLGNVKVHVTNHLLPVVDKDLVGMADDVVLHLVGSHLNHRGALVDAVRCDKGLAGGGLGDDELRLFGAALRVGGGDDGGLADALKLLFEPLGLGDVEVAQVDGLQGGNSLADGHDGGAADDAGAHQGGDLGVLGRGVLGKQAGHGRGAHGGDERGIHDAEGQHGVGIAQDGNVNAVGDAGGGGVFLGLTGPFDAAHLDVAADVGRHGVEKGGPVLFVGDFGADLGVVDDFALAEELVGFFAGGQHLLHVEQAGLDDVLLLEKQNFRLDHVKSPP